MAKALDTFLGLSAARFGMCEYIVFRYSHISIFSIFEIVTAWNIRYRLDVLLPLTSWISEENLETIRQQYSSYF
jgi:hypothetical protein